MNLFNKSKHIENPFACNKYLKEKYDLVEFKDYRDIPGWINDAEWIYEKIVNESEDGDEFLEIGTLFGQSTARMCELIRDSGKKLSFYSMDVYHFIESDLFYGRFPASFTKFRNDHHYASIYNLVIDILTFLKLKQFVELICCDSQIGHRLFKDNQFKMIYIDGNHAYEFVLGDLLNWYPKVKPGGYIICDDIVYESVVKALETFRLHFQLEKKDFVYGTYSCTIKKP